MRGTRLLLIVLLVWAGVAAAQVVSPMEMQAPAMRQLQRRHLKQLEAAGAELNHHHFPFPFYFSRRLDLEQSLQKQLDQRSIRFGLYKNRRALEITGNYYAAYAEKYVDADHRVRDTYEAVILPILKAVVPRLAHSGDFDLFAVEVSHHVRRKVMGLDTEVPENVAVFLPRKLAEQVVQAPEPLEQQRLLLDAEVYRNGEPTVIWLAGERPLMREREDENASAHAAATPARPSAPVPIADNAGNEARALAPSRRSYPSVGLAPLPNLHRETLHAPNKESLKQLQSRYQKAIQALVQKEGKEAHFVPYAPPAFIAFKGGSYLELSLKTPLDAGVEDSQYKLAALAFDRHISHLVRPVIGYFQKPAGFDGIDFSTTVELAGDRGHSHAMAVEFILPFSAMRRFAQYDSTGQQLLNEGIVLINGERVGLELETAEAR